jgi:hypothetical protein
MDGYESLNVFVDAVIFIELSIDNVINNKATFEDRFKKAVKDQYDQIASIYVTVDDDPGLKFELGELLNDFDRQCERIMSYDFGRLRKSQNYLAMTDAYSDPEIAALAEYTKGGLKTRNKFYKR